MKNLFKFPKLDSEAKVMFPKLVGAFLILCGGQMLVYQGRPYEAITLILLGSAFWGAGEYNEDMNHMELQKKYREQDDDFFNQMLGES